MSQTDDAEAIAAAHFIMAKGPMEHLQSYTDRGRQFQFIEADQLQKLFLERFHAWAVAVATAGRQQLDDVEAEYKLRGIRAPFSLVKDDIKRVVTEIDDRAKQMDAETLREINNDILAEYRNARKSQN